MSARDQTLTVEIVDDRLVISIGIDALMIAARAADDWDEDAEIIDPDAFAAEIARHLENDEDDDGTTQLHLAFDAAVMAAVEAGSEAVQWPGDGA